MFSKTQMGLSKVDGPNTAKIRRAKLKLYSHIPYLKSETTKQDLFANAVAYLPADSPRSL